MGEDHGGRLRAVLHGHRLEARQSELRRETAAT